MRTGTTRPFIKTISALATITALTGCMGAGTASQLVTARTAVEQSRSGPQIIESDLSRSCTDLSSMASAVYARHEEIVSAAQAREARRGMISGIANTGLSILGVTGMANAGSINGMRTVSAATQAAGLATNAAINSTGQTNLQEITDVSVLTQRAAQIERAKLQKGCA